MSVSSSASLFDETQPSPSLKKGTGSKQAAVLDETAVLDEATVPEVATMPEEAAGPEEAAVAQEQAAEGVHSHEADEELSAEAVVEEKAVAVEEEEGAESTPFRTDSFEALLSSAADAEALAGLPLAEIGRLESLFFEESQRFAEREGAELQFPGIAQDALAQALRKVGKEQERIEELRAELAEANDRMAQGGQQLLQLAQRLHAYLTIYAEGPSVEVLAGEKSQAKEPNELQAALKRLQLDTKSAQGARKQRKRKSASGAAS